MNLEITIMLILISCSYVPIYTIGPVCYDSYKWVITALGHPDENGIPYESACSKGFFPKLLLFFAGVASFHLEHIYKYLYWYLLFIYFCNAAFSQCPLLMLNKHLL